MSGNVRVDHNTVVQGFWLWASANTQLKGPLKTMQRVKIAHSFLQSVKSVLRYHFKIASVVLRMAVKELFETHFQKWRNGPFSRPLFIE